ncbi:uncharacterized protein K444DRAFT_48734 [Hyaloscypha bicolor E]|uniref:Uncharacterized protein n=1 Tax=Hyaloscypha bicolor E TaxID=1095630 RepID=A0A2J6T2M0_9HELO|nr:uncharacterized protein K444DRAFT_48734 [Hyaloscypha bicolor E]PMD57183.1 hypothetical protein K444DRAFT_48734 [Hyaloscypha bicolor E]
MASTTAGTIIAVTVEGHPRLASISTCLSVEPSRQNRRRLILSLVLTLLYSSRSRSQPEPASDQGSVHRFSIEFSYDNLNFSYHIRATGALSGSGANTGKPGYKGKKIWFPIYYPYKEVTLITSTLITSTLITSTLITRFPCIIFGNLYSAYLHP